MLVHEGLFKPKCPETTWVTKIPDCLNHINRTVHSTTKFAPALLFEGLDYSSVLKEGDERKQ